MNGEERIQDHLHCRCVLVLRWVVQFPNRVDRPPVQHTLAEVSILDVKLSSSYSCILQMTADWCSYDHLISPQLRSIILASIRSSKALSEPVDTTTSITAKRNAEQTTQ